MGFLDQEHRLTPTLTVGESVLMAAMLRMPACVSMEERQKKVAQVLRALHIDHLVHARIGECVCVCVCVCEFSGEGLGGRKGGWMLYMCSKVSYSFFFACL
jgi:hypothetical protein